jgi:hypothetical protein
VAAPSGSPPVADDQGRRRRHDERDPTDADDAAFTQAAKSPRIEAEPGADTDLCDSGSSAGQRPWSPLMSAVERWRPRLVRTTGSITESIYGLILATSVIAVSQEYDDSNAGRIGVTVLVTGVVFWLAHLYARVLAGSISRRRMLDRSEVREAFRHDWPLVEVTVPLVLILALGVLDAVPDRAAILAATIAALVELGAAGAYAARTSGAGLLGTVASAVIAVTLGSAVVLLKALVH